MSNTLPCFYACWKPTPCPTCKRNMPPRGRSVPGVLADAYCQCEHATDSSINPRHLWDEHDSDRNYFHAYPVDTHGARKFMNHA